MRFAPALLLALVLPCSVALAQGKGGGGAPPGGGIPPGMDPAAIKERVKQAIQQLVASAPETTVELKGLLKITYKKVPTDPKQVAETLGKQMGGGGAPAGVDMDGMIKQYEPEIAQMLNENLTDIGKFEVLVPLKVKSKTIPVGEWRFGIEFEGERPAALVLRGDGLPGKKPLPIRLKTRSVDLQKELLIEIKEPKKQKEGAENFELQVTFLRFQAKSASKLERGKTDAAAGEDKEDDDKEKEGEKEPEKEGEKDEGKKE